MVRKQTCVQTSVLQDLSSKSQLVLEVEANLFHKCNFHPLPYNQQQATTLLNITLRKIKHWSVSVHLFYVFLFLEVFSTNLTCVSVTTV